MDETLTAGVTSVDRSLAALLPLTAPGLAARVIEPLCCLALRHLPGGLAATEAVLADAGLPPLPAPGRVVGTEPWLVWRSPTETLLMATDDTAAVRVLAALRTGRHTLACGVDLSAGGIAFELEGTAPGLEALLSRLIDASAIPRFRGHGTRARLADVAISVLRLAEDRVWLLADCSHDRYLALWLARAMEAVASDAQCER